MHEMTVTDFSLLEACAVAMSMGEEHPGSLYALLDAFTHAPEEVFRILAEGVEYESEGTRTVRRADPALVRDKMGQGHPLVVCDHTTSKEMVVAITSDMILYEIGPYKRGLRIATRANEAEVRAYHDSLAQMKRRAELKTAAEKETNRILHMALVHLCDALASCTNTAQRDDALSALGTSSIPPSFGAIVEACIALQVSVIDVLRGGTPK